MVRHRDAGRPWRPAFGMFFPAEVTRRVVITGEFRGVAPGIAILRPAGEFHRAGGLAGAKVPVSSSQPCRAFGAAARRHRGDAAEPGGNLSSTGHVWITIWRRYERDPFRIFSPPSLPTASVLVTGGGAARVSPGTSPGTAPRSGLYAQFIDESCAQPPTLVISPGLA